MVKRNDPKTIASYINCLSYFENNVFQLYKNLSNKVELPLVKTLLLCIAQDSQKHAMILKAVGESIAKPEGKPKNCEKQLGESWMRIDAFNKEIAKKEKITEAELAKLSEKLVVLESIAGEEYYMFVQLKTLQLLMKEINQLYSIDLRSLKSLFANIISDEERHRTILQTVQRLLKRKEKKQKDNAPAVKYQNPDMWSRPLPPTI
jgi:rubrerythrin